VDAHGFFGDLQLRADVAVALALGDQRQHLQFARRQILGRDAL